MGDRYKTHDKFYTNEQFDMVDDCLEPLYPAYGFPGLSNVQRAMYEYVEGGAKTLDEVIEESQRILDMMQKEQYIGQ